jgi:hypothetical protein
MSMMVNPFVFAAAGGGGGFGSHRYWRLAISQNAGDASLTCVGELEFHSTVGGADITGSGTAISGGSGAETDVAANAFDDVILSTNQWGRSSPTDTWIGYDFGSAVAVAEVLVHGRGGTEWDQSPQDFTLDWSDDGSAWTTAETFNAYGWIPSVGKTFPETPAAGFHRFWRINTASVNGGARTQISEVEFRATSGGADQATGGRAWAANSDAVTTAHKDPTLIDTLGFDNNTGTESVVFTTTGVLGYCFPSPVEVQEVLITGSANTTRCPNTFKIQSSDDGVTWTDEKSLSGVTWTATETKTYAVP